MELFGKGVPDREHRMNRAWRVENNRPPWEEARRSLWLEDRAFVGS